MTAWWQWAVLGGLQAFWTLFAVSFGANVVNRTRDAQEARRQERP